MPSVVFVLLRADRQVLMEQRPPDDRHFRDGLVFPGGKVEEGETHEQTLLREMREELAVTPKRFVLLESPSLLYWGVEGNPKYRVFPHLVTDWSGLVPPVIIDTGCPLSWHSIADARQAKAGLTAQIAGLVDDWVTSQFERSRA